MAGSGFTLLGTKMTSDQVVYAATQGDVAPSTYFLVIGSTAVQKYRRNEIITTVKLLRDRSMKLLSTAADMVTNTQSVSVQAVPNNVKTFTVNAAYTTIGHVFAAGVIELGLSGAAYVQGLNSGNPSHMGSSQLYAAVEEILHAYMRLNSAD